MPTLTHLVRKPLPMGLTSQQSKSKRGPTLTIFEALFLVLLAALLAGLVIAASRWARGQRSQALRLLRLLSAWTTVYLLIDIAVAISAVREFHQAGEMQCFDDWCMRTLQAHRTHDDLVEVTLQLSSRAKRISQGERGTVAYLLDLQGQRYDAIPETMVVPFDTLLSPGQTLMAVRQFRVPSQLRQVNLVYEHGGFPVQLFIIGQAGSWVHGPAMTSLDIR